MATWLSQAPAVGGRPPSTRSQTARHGQYSSRVEHLTLHKDAEKMSVGDLGSVGYLCSCCIMHVLSSRLGRLHVCGDRADRGCEAVTAGECSSSSSSSLSVHSSRCPPQRRTFNSPSDTNTRTTGQGGCNPQPSSSRLSLTPLTHRIHTQTHSYLRLTVRMEERECIANHSSTAYLSNQQRAQQHHHIRPPTSSRCWLVRPVSLSSPPSSHFPRLSCLFRTCSPTTLTCIVSRSPTTPSPTSSPSSLPAPPSTRASLTHAPAPLCCSQPAVCRLGSARRWQDASWLRRM